MSFNGASFGAAKKLVSGVAGGLTSTSQNADGSIKVTYSDGNSYDMALPSGSAVIDDTETSNAKVWSSGKVYNELSSKLSSDQMATINGQSITEGGNIVIQSGGTSDEIPSYYATEYATTKAKVESLSSNDSFNILCATDLHFSPKGSGYEEAKLRGPLFNMFKAFRKAEREMPMALVTTLGDYMQMPSGYTKAMGISNIAELNAELSSINTPKMAICGNHEASYSGNTGAIGLTDDELYNLLLKKYVGRDIHKASKNVFYMFDDVNEVCYLFISAKNNTDVNTHLQSAFDSVITANTNNYPYLVLCHFAIDTVNDVLWNGVANAIDYIKTTKNKPMIAWVGGHKHCDWVKAYNNTLVVSLINSGFYANNQGQDGNTYSKTVGTISESAFSILTINKTLGKLYVTRFGAGVDIECNYNTTSGAIGRVEETEPQNYWFNVDTATAEQYSTSKTCGFTSANGNVTMNVTQANSGIKLSNTVSELPVSTKKTLKLVADSGTGTDDLFAATVEFFEGSTKVGTVTMLSSSYTEKLSNVVDGGITRTVSSSVLSAITNADKVVVTIRAASSTADLPNLPYNLSFNNLRVELS